MTRFRQWLIEQLGGFTTDMDVYVVANSTMTAYFNEREKNRRLERECAELKRQLEEVMNNGKDQEGTA